MADGSEILIFLDQKVQVVRKFRARRMTLSISPDRPMRVTSNLSTSLEEIMIFLNSNSKWIHKNIDKVKAFSEKYQNPILENGSLFPYLGEMKYFTFAKSKLNRSEFAVEDGFLVCYIPDLSNVEKRNFDDLKIKLQVFFKKKGIEYLQVRVNYWAQRTGLIPFRLKFGRATTRWGSCNSKKHLNLNWKLICYAPHLIDYVIVHELCHLRHLNHSEDFWNLVATHMPEYGVYEKTLDEQVNLSRFLNSIQPASN